jgi:4-amino-4-deoxy-L-arabinose transferase-like glycosyltransferase
MSVVNAARRRATPASAWRNVATVDRRWMLSLFGIAFALRLIFALAATRSEMPVNDTFFYHTIAEQIANGHGFSLVSGAPTSAWPPGYPFILAALYTVFGEHVVVGELFNALVSALTVPLVYALARNQLGTIEARFAATGLALLPSQIFWTGVLLTESLAVLLTVLVLYVAVRTPPTTRTLLVLGVLIGISTLVRGESAFLLVIPLVIWWREVRRPQLWRRMAIVCAAVALTIAPWTIRNAVTMHAFIPVSNNVSSTLWAGHNPKAQGGPNYPDQAALDKKLGNKRGSAREVAQSKILQSAALRYMRTHPARELVLIPDKAIALIGPASLVFYYWIDPPQLKHQIGHNAAQRLSTLADFAWFGLLALTFLSLFAFGSVLRRNRLLLGSLGFICVSLVLYCFVFYGNFRYRATLEPLTLLLAAPLFARAVALRRGRPAGAART